jgi:hypothetical protein
MDIKLRTDQEIAQEYVQRLKEADAGSPTLLGFLGETQRAAEESLKADRERVAAKYGLESARLKQFDERLTAQKNLRTAIAADHQRSRIVVPKPQEKAAVIHGRVIGEKGSVRGVDVNAFSVDGRTPLASAKTEELGHFNLTFATEAAAQVLLEVREKDRRVYRDKEPRDVAAGSVVYTEIVIEPAESDDIRVKEAVIAQPRPADTDESGGKPKPKPRGKS